MQRCPDCNVLLTEEESQWGGCPFCEEEPIPAEEPVATWTKQDSPPRPPHRWRFLVSVAITCFLLGGVSGFSLRTWTSAETTKPAPQESPSITTLQDQIAQVRGRVKELEASVAKLAKQKDSQTKDSKAANKRTKHNEPNAPKEQRETKQIISLKPQLTLGKKVVGGIIQEAKSIAKNAMYFRVRTPNKAKWVDLKVNKNGGQIRGYRMKSLGNGAHEFTLRRLTPGELLEWEYCYQNGGGQKQTGFQWRAWFTRPK